MFNSFKKRVGYIIPDIQQSNHTQENISKESNENIAHIRFMCGNTADLIIRELDVSGVHLTFVMFESMTDSLSVNLRIIEPVKKLKIQRYNSEEFFEQITKSEMLASDKVEIFTYDEIIRYAMSGFVILLVGGLDKGYALGMQGFAYRQVSEPTSEMNIRGSKEGFCDVLKINQSLIRRRIKSPLLRFESMQIGSVSQTDVALVYIKGKVPNEVIRAVRQKISKIRLESVLDSGYVAPFLESDSVSLFSTVGNTERPDVLCGKIMEGRLGIIVDGTPFVLIVPYLFTEHFQTMDDYCENPFFTTFIRVLKLMAFMVTTLFPGLYIAIVTYHPEILPNTLILTISKAEASTPFSALFEAFLLFFIFEVIREAGLRLPQRIGQAVSIVGAIIIGDAAISAGIIGAPILIVMAVTAICSYIVPTLYEEASALRLITLICGGSAGFLGLSIGIIVLGVNLCSKTNMTIPYTSPLTPFSLRQNGDVIYHTGWKRHQKKRVKISEITGSNIKNVNKEGQ